MFNASSYFSSISSGSISIFSEISKILLSCSFFKNGFPDMDSSRLQEYIPISPEFVSFTEHKASFSSSPINILIILLEELIMSSLAVPEIINLKI